MLKYQMVIIAKFNKIESETITIPATKTSTDTKKEQTAQGTENEKESSKQTDEQTKKDLDKEKQTNEQNKNNSEKETQNINIHNSENISSKVLSLSVIFGRPKYFILYSQSFSLYFLNISNKVSPLLFFLIKLKLVLLKLFEYFYL